MMYTEMGFENQDAKVLLTQKRAPSMLVGGQSRIQNYLQDKL